MSFDTRALTRFSIALVFVFSIDESADAAGQIDRRPGAFCKPLDPAMAQHVLYNSGGAIANMSSTESVWVVCPVRTPAQGDTVVRVINTFLTADPVPCIVRLTTPDGDGWSFPTTQATQLGGPDARLNSASMRCQLPPSGALGPQGIISVTTSTMPLYQYCVGEGGCDGQAWCGFDGSCDECRCW